MITLRVRFDVEQETLFDGVELYFVEAAYTFNFVSPDVLSIPEFKTETLDCLQEATVTDWALVELMVQ